MHDHDERQIDAHFDKLAFQIMQRKAKKKKKKFCTPVDKVSLNIHGYMCGSRN